MMKICTWCTFSSAFNIIAHFIYIYISGWTFSDTPLPPLKSLFPNLTLMSLGETLWMLIGLHPLSLYYADTLSLLLSLSLSLSLTHTHTHTHAHARTHTLLRWLGLGWGWDEGGSRFNSLEKSLHFKEEP